MMPRVSLGQKDHCPVGQRLVSRFGVVLVTPHPGISENLFGQGRQIIPEFQAFEQDLSAAGSHLPL